MRVHLKLIWVVALLALLIPALMGYVGLSGAYDSTGDTGEHLNSKSIDNQTCNNCHDKLVDGGAGTGGNSTNAHKRHVMSVFLNYADGQGGANSSEYGCGACHEQTRVTRMYENDVTGSDAVAVAPAGKQVDPNVCVSCHGDFVASPSADASGHDFSDLGSDSPRGCTESCHELGGAGTASDPAVVHASASASSTIDLRYAQSKDFCTKCHGELQWYEIDETN